MAADAIVYCLENVTDYAQFERLSHDLMLAEGYLGLEPIGGWSDKGRDAIHVAKKSPNEKISIFAYSVREDWFEKLKEDAKKIHKHGHPCQNLVMVSTSLFSASERDKAIAFIKSKYGWDFHLYGIERIRTILIANQHILVSHPQIFCPPFFTIAGGLTLAFSPEYVIIDYSDEDQVMAAWLARKLKLHGYLVWCRAVDPIAGESINDTTEALVEKRAFVYVPILSDSAICDADFNLRRNIAYQSGRSRGLAFVLPLLVSEIDESLFDSKTREVQKIDFSKGWQAGLSKLIQRIDSLNCPKTTEGKSCALNSFFPVYVVTNNDEVVLSNLFPVIQTPETISRYVSKDGLTSEIVSKMSLSWAFRKVRPNTFLSFYPPPEDIENEFELKKAGGAAWAYVDDIDNISSINLVSELIKKSLKVLCSALRLALNKKNNQFYFPSGLLPNNRLSVKRPNARAVSISAVGERSFYRPGGSEIYRYHLSPNFYVRQIEDKAFFVNLRIFIFLTDQNGVPLEGQKVNSRRKHLCKDWWNNDWLNRILAVMQYLGNGQDISFGSEKNKILTIGVSPLSWNVPVSINEAALSEQSYTRDYLDLDLSDDEDEPEEDNDQNEGEDQ